MKLISLHPVARGTAAALAIVGTILARPLIPMLAIWGCAVLPLLVSTRLARRHAAFCLSILLPMTIGLVLVWGVLIGAPPGHAPGTDHRGGFLFALTTGARLALLGGIMQLTLLSIPAAELPYVLSRWGFGKELMAVTLGTFALWPEMRTRATQLYTARCARGLLRTRSLAQRVHQLPYMMRALLSWTIRAAIQRSELWNQRGTLTKLATLSEHPASKWGTSDLVFCVAAFQWFAYNIAHRVYP
jgi:energy-coupling factor transporter transmembrane protein EcfT